MSNDPPPAIIPQAVHATGGARGFTSSEPCSTTSPPGSFPAAHVARTELNDHRPGTVPTASAAPRRARLVLGRSPGYNATHPPAIPPSECRPPPPNRTPAPTHAKPRPSPPEHLALHPVIKFAAPSGARKPTNSLITPSHRVDHEVGGDITDTKHCQIHDRSPSGRADRGTATAAPILQVEPCGRPVCALCGVPKCKIGGDQGEACSRLLGAPP